MLGAAATVAIGAVAHAVNGSHEGGGHEGGGGGGILHVNRCERTFAKLSRRHRFPFSLFSLYIFSPFISKRRSRNRLSSFARATPVRVCPKMQLVAPSGVENNSMCPKTFLSRSICKRRRRRKSFSSIASILFMKVEKEEDMEKEVKEMDDRGRGGRGGYENINSPPCTDFYRR
jgi:hypothetical protein